MVSISPSKSLLGAPETSIHNFFNSHITGLMLISTDSSLKQLETGMDSLHLLYPLLNVLKIVSLDSHHWWDLGTSPLIHWPCGCHSKILSLCGDVIQSSAFVLWKWTGEWMSVDVSPVNYSDSDLIVHEKMTFQYFSHIINCIGMSIDLLLKRSIIN